MPCISIERDLVQEVDSGLMTRGMLKIVNFSRTICDLLNVCVSGQFVCECC